MSTDDVMSRAVDAAARVLADDEPSVWAAGCNCGSCATVQAREALRAALPVLLADLADRIDRRAAAVPKRFNDHKAGYEGAADLVRSFVAEVQA